MQPLVDYTSELVAFTRSFASFGRGLLRQHGRGDRDFAS